MPPHHLKCSYMSEHSKLSGSIIVVITRISRSLSTDSASMPTSSVWERLPARPEDRRSESDWTRAARTTWRLDAIGATGDQRGPLRTPQEGAHRYRPKDLYTLRLYRSSKSEYSAFTCASSAFSLRSSIVMVGPSGAGCNRLSMRRRMASWNEASGRKMSLGQRSSARTKCR